MIVDQGLFLMLISIAVALLPGISRFLRIPAPVMEIIFGVVLGKSFLHLQFSGEWLPFLAHLGFLLLMFHSGMEINFEMLKKLSRRELALQLMVFCTAGALSFLSALLLGRGVFMALVLTTTSLGLVMPTLKEAGISKTAFGQTVLIAASLADFLTLLGITFFVLWRHLGLSWKFFSPLGLLAGFGLLLWAGRMWAWWYPRRAERLLGTEDSQEVGVRLSMAILFLFVALSELTQMEPVLGAFLGGCLLSFMFREKSQLENKLSALGFGFLIPIFFINVGMQFDLTGILEVGRLFFTSKLLFLALFVKIASSMLLSLHKLSAREALQAGVLLSSRLSLIVAAASIGVEEGLITSDLKDSIVLLALLSCLVGPTAFKLMQRKEARAALLRRRS